MAKKILKKAQLGEAMKSSNKADRLSNRKERVATRIVREDRKGADANFNKANRLEKRFDNLVTKQRAAEDAYEKSTNVTRGYLKKGGTIKKKK
jgi:hypothetical protein